MKIDFFTMGVYGLNSEQFFNKIRENGIDTFIDIRRRRAVRGNKYSFVNSCKLQSEIKNLGINYLHIIELAPTNEIRRIQKIADISNNIAKRDRSILDKTFSTEYVTRVLDLYDFNALIGLLEDLHTKKALFFCVEAEANACHRSLVTEKIKSLFNANIFHL